MLFVRYLNKKVFLQNLNYWNVELQEAYFSYKEAQLKEKKKKKDKLFPSIMRPYPLRRIFSNFFF